MSERLAQVPLAVERRAGKLTSFSWNQPQRHRDIEIGKDEAGMMNDER
jgi:hypothetical protein